MPDPKKPGTVDEIVSLLKGLITEPVTDQSSRPPTAADVKRVRAAANPPKRRKAVKKKTATKKKVVTKKKRTTKKKKSARK